MSAAGCVGQRGFSCAVLDPVLPVPPGLRSWNGSDITARFAVYRNNVVSSLADVLVSTFPVVAELVGDAFFRAMAGQYVRLAPPSSPVLALYGDGFAEYIAGFTPAAPLPYLADVARLEYARIRACHSADRLPVDAVAIHRAMASGEHIADLSFSLHPSVIVIDSPCAVVSIWAAHQGVGRLVDVDPLRAETAIVLRSGLDVLVLPSTAAAGRFVESLRCGDPLGQAAARAAKADATFDPAAPLGQLFHHAAITSISLPQENPR